MHLTTIITNLLHHALLYDPEQPLVFTQLAFWLFFTLILLLYSIAYNRRPTTRSACLLCVSAFFYYKASGICLALLLLVIAATYLLALCIGRGGKRWRAVWLTLGISINLSLLAYFKYSELLLQTINNILDADYQLQNPLSDTTQIALPVGISFYIFQAISYLIDIKHRHTTAERNPIHFGLYISFFPQLVAGPIVRASEFLPQLRQPYSVSQHQFWLATILIMSGLSKKIIVSDYLAFHFIDRMFDAPSLYSGIELLTGAYAYAIQIYCDFSGYTDIAIGIAAMLGFTLPQNFRSPYRAHSIADFWRRWHITLSTWLRDYLYIPLGGNRKGMRRTCINLLITMILGGLWHGAAAKFLLWGALHGIVLALDKLLSTLMQRRLPHFRMPRVIGGILTFHIVCLLWLFFRASTTDAALDYIFYITQRFDPSLLPDVFIAYLPVFIVLLLAYLFHFLPASYKRHACQLFVMLPVAIKLLCILLLIFLMLQAASAGNMPFIYFQF